ncbi:MAG: DUF4129 domain-containing protein [Pirellulaceae bacterium]
MVMRFGLVALTLTEAAVGQTLPEEPAVESAREMFRERVRFPWYDADRDAIKRLDVSPPKDLQNRFSKWETVPSGKVPAWLAQVLRVVGWMLVGGAILLVTVLLVRALLRIEVGAARVTQTQQTASDRGVIQRVGKLPFPLRVEQADLWGEARRCFDAGDYGQAIIYLYSYQLVQLDEHQLIRLAKGKTNRQYLHEMRRRPRLRGLLETTMIAFEDVFFGRRALERARFENCWHAMDDFHQQIDQIELAAS